MNEELISAWGKTAAQEDLSLALASITHDWSTVGKYLQELGHLGDTILALIQAGEDRRLGRVGDIKVGQIVFNGRKISSMVKGTTGWYETHITVLPTRGHHCTCPDWEKNGKMVGPCKHVLALGLAFRQTRLVPAFDRVTSGLMNILEHSEV